MHQLPARAHKSFNVPMQRVVRFCKALRQGAEPRRGVRAPHFGAPGSQGAPVFAAAPRRTWALQGHRCCGDKHQPYGAAANPSVFPNRRKGSSVSQTSLSPGRRIVPEMLLCMETPSNELCQPQTCLPESKNDANPLYSEGGCICIGKKLQKTSLS